MPTFNKKTGKNEYFILARPSDAGNITYQVTSGARQLLLNLGYSDSEDLPWAIVKPLRMAGLLYTKSEGPKPTVDLENVPQLDSDKLKQASPDEKRDVLEYLESHSDISKSTLQEIKDYLGTNYKLDETASKSDGRFYEKCESLIKSKFEDSDLILGDVQVKPTNVGFSISITVEEDSHVNNSDTSTTGVISIEELKTSWADSEIEHRLLIVDETNIVEEAEKGIDEWVVNYKENITWEERAKVVRSRAAVLTVLTDVAEELDFTLGEPTDGIAYFGPDGFV